MTKCSAFRTMFCKAYERTFMSRNFSKQVSASLEDYLEVIYEIIDKKKGVKAIDISRKLGVGRSSVTDALKTLAEKNLVNYGRYDVLSLTEEGEKLAREVIVKHSVLYDFFISVLGLSPEEADENACRIEHVISDNAFEGFVKFMKVKNKK